MQDGNRRAILAALGANLGIAIAKFVGYAMTASASLLAEAVHSLADTGNQALLLWGGVAARRPANDERPFGHGRERYFWAFIVSLVLFSLGSVFAINEGLHKLSHPEPLQNAGWAIGILALGVVFESFSFWMAVRESARVKGDASWWNFVRHSKAPELPVVLLEDLGALLGLMIALAGIGLAIATGEPRFDAYGSIAIGALLGVIAIVLAVEMRSLLIGESASNEDIDRIRSAILAGDDVLQIIDMRTEHIGPERLLIGAKVEFRASISLRELASAIDATEARVRADVRIAKVIYIEPDVWREPES